MLQQTIITYDTCADFIKALPENIKQDTTAYFLYLQSKESCYDCLKELPTYLTLYYMPKNHIKTEEGVISITSDMIVMYNDNGILKQVVVGYKQCQETSKEKLMEVLTEVAVGTVKKVKRRIQEEKSREETLEIWKDYIKEHC